MANSAHSFSAPAPHAGPSRRTRIVLGLLALVCSTLSAHANRTSLRHYAVLALKDGRQLSAVRVVSYTANGILVQHSGGATTLRTKLLPDDVIFDLRLSRLETVETTAAEAAFLALADKPAVEENAPAVAASAPVEAAGESTAPAAELLASAPADAPAALPEIATLAAATTPAATEAVTPPPAGEGNIPEFFAAQTAIAPAAGNLRTAAAGRVVIALASGKSQMLEGVEVRVYPAALLETYLREADARCQEGARKFLAHAAAATAEGRVADAERLTVHAQRAAADRLAHLPAAPYSTRTDAFGHFTISHPLPEVRLVAIGHATVAQEQVRYEWIGVASGREVILTEANATTVATTARPVARFAAR